VPPDTAPVSGARNFPIAIIRACLVYFLTARWHLGRIPPQEAETGNRAVLSTQTREKYGG
jgi:hypothetical protein